MSQGHATPRSLGWWIDTRRRQLQLSWKEVSAAGNLSRQTVNNVRSSTTRPADETQYGLERALRWEPGSVLAILNGGEPTPLALDDEKHESDDGPRTWAPQRLSDAVALVEELWGRQEANDLLRSWHDRNNGQVNEGKGGQQSAS